MNPTLRKVLPALIVVACIAFFYYFIYLTPISNNAFVVANIRPVAANVEGYVTNIYVKNDEYVKKGHPLFTVFKRPYELAYQKSNADVAHAKAKLIAIRQQVNKTKNLLDAKKAVYEKWQFDYKRYAQALRDHAISAITVNNTLRESNTAYSEMKALQNELAIEQQNIIIQQKEIESLEAVMLNAKVNLDETTVYAQKDGIVQNMFVGLGTPVKIRTPLFSFMETDSIAIQSNMNETELGDVKPGNKVSIRPRIYFGRKVYHGIVKSINWSANRQYTYDRTQQQIVKNSEDNWFLLPQRVPVYILITDYDPKHFPLAVGESAYVHIHTT